MNAWLVHVHRTFSNPFLHCEVYALRQGAVAVDPLSRNIIARCTE